MPVSSRRERLRLSALAVAALVIVYWAAFRTPIIPIEGRAAFAIESARLLLAAGAAVLAVLAAVLWLEDDRLRAVRRVRSYAGRLPAWTPAVLVALAGSYLAGRIAITRTPENSAEYWPAIVLWLASMSLVFVASAPAAWFELTRHRPTRASLARVRSLDLLFVVALTAIAAALRLPALDSIPPFVHGDEELIGLDGLRTIEGDLRNVFGVGWGANPVLGFAYYGAFIKLFGTDFNSVRIGSAVWGIIAVPMMYLMLREMFGRWVALTGAIFLSGYYLHLHFSRVGINVIWDTPMMLAALYFIYRGTRDNAPGRAFDFAAAGLIAGISQYLYHGTRVVPIVLVVYLMYVGVFRWSWLRNNVANIALFLAAFAVAAAPGGMYSITHEHAFTSRLESTGLVQSGYWEEQRELGRSPFDIMRDQTEHAFGGWFHYGDQSPFRFSHPPEPLIIGLAGLALLIGIAYALVRIDDRRSALLLIAFAVPTFIGGALTVGPPNAQRLFGAVPAAIALVALGLWQPIWHALWWPRLRAFAPLVVVPVAVWLAVSDARFYFDRAEDSRVWGAIVHRFAIDYIDDLPEDTRIYWYGAPHVSAGFSPLSLHDRPRIDVYDPSANPVPRAEHASPSVYMFMQHRVARLSSVREQCPGGSVRTLDFDGAPLLTIYELPEPNLCVPDPQPPDHFDDAVVIEQPRAGDITTTAMATLDAGEPQPCAPVANTVWFTYTPRGNAIVYADTHGSVIPTVLAAYRKDDDGALELIACDHADDGRSQVRFDGVAGEPLFYQVAHPASLQPARQQYVAFNLLEPGQ